MGEGGTSLLTTEVATVVSGFAADIMPTVLELIGIIVPVGLGLWALGFGIKKGISYLQRRASKAI